MPRIIGDSGRRASYEFSAVNLSEPSRQLGPAGPGDARTPNVTTDEGYQKGWFEVQDEGSQLLALLLEARRGEMVVDFCAGAGGKTLQMGAAMGSTGRLYAFDVSDKRLTNLAPRLKRSGLSNVFPQRITGEEAGGTRCAWGSA